MSSGFFSALGDRVRLIPAPNFGDGALLVLVAQTPGSRNTSVYLDRDDLATLQNLIASLPAAAPDTPQ